MCARCGGQVITNPDQYGDYRRCAQCARDPEGLVLVPPEPTEEEFRRWRKQGLGGGRKVRSLPKPVPSAGEHTRVLPRFRK